MEKARYNTELYSNLRVPLNNVKPSNFWGAHQARNGATGIKGYTCVVKIKKAEAI